MRHLRNRCFTASVICGVAASLLLCPALFADDAPAAGAKPWKNPLAKQGYVGSPLVEVTPFVFQRKLYLSLIHI